MRNRGFLAKYNQHDTADQIDVELTSKLSAILQDANKLRRQLNADQSSKYFKALRNQTDLTSIQSALDWLADNIKDPYTPKIRSAKSLFQKFSKLQAAIERERATPERDKTIIISPQAAYIANYLGLFWPNQEKQDELQFLQASLANYEDYVARLRRAYTEEFAANKTSRDTRLLKFFLDRAGAPQHQIREYAADVHRIAWSWEGWRGNLLRWVWSLNSKRVHRQMQQQANEWCAQPQRWLWIKERLGYV